MKSIFLFLLLCLFMPVVHANTTYFQYEMLPGLPANRGYSEQPGLAGPYTGIDNGVIILAGGANFPDKLPWEGGEKVFYDEIFIGIANATDRFSWVKSQQLLPYKVGYGGAVETPEGLLCFGGNTSDEVIDDAWFIRYNPSKGDVEIKPGPQLPVPLTNFAFAKVDGYLYVAGGLSEMAGPSGNHFYRLNLSGSNPDAWKWEALSPWKGKPRAFSVGAGQSNGETNCFYLFSGRNIQPGQDPVILYDAHVFNPRLNSWSVISDGAGEEFPVMAGTAFPLGAATIVFPSGANGEMMKKQLEIENQLTALGSSG